MDEYPSISPYAYCAWNPVNLVDPDGMETDDWEVDKNGNITRCKDQSYAVPGKDRLFQKPILGHARPNKSKTFVEVEQGTFEKCENRRKGMINYKDRIFENEDKSEVHYDATVILMDNNECDAINIFEFLSSYTNIEWSIIGKGNKDLFILQLRINAAMII